MPRKLRGNKSFTNNFFFLPSVKTLTRNVVFLLAQVFLIRRHTPLINPPLQRDCFWIKPFFKGLLSRTQNPLQPTPPILRCSRPPSARNAFSFFVPTPLLEIPTLSAQTSEESVLSSGLQFPPQFPYVTTMNKKFFCCLFSPVVLQYLIYYLTL